MVILATLAVPFDPEAVRVAAQAALETNSRLIVVDAVERPWWPQSLTMRYAELELDEDRAQIKELVAQMVGPRARGGAPADSLGEAGRRVLDLAGEYQAGLLVLGPDRSRFRPAPVRADLATGAQARALSSVGHRRGPLYARL